MSKDLGQLGDMARLFVQLKPNFKWISLVSLVAALLVGAYVALTHEPAYQSEAIAIVRPQQVPVSRSRKDEAQPREEKGKSLLPQPLNVTDYVLFLKSDGMLASIAQAYNTYHASESEPLLTVAQLRRMMTPTARLEIKTPYTVEYYPTIELHVSAQSPDKTYELARLWVETARDWSKTVTFSAKKEMAGYLKNETEEQRAALRDLSEELNRTKDESGELLEALRAERLRAEEEYESETIRLLQETGDTWDARIAAAEAEFALPLMETELQARESILAGLRLTQARKTLELERARAALPELTTQTGAADTLESIATSWDIALPGEMKTIEPMAPPLDKTETLREEELEKRAEKRLLVDLERRENIRTLLQDYTKSPHRKLQDEHEKRFEDILEALEKQLPPPKERPEPEKGPEVPELGLETPVQLDAFRVETDGGNPVGILLQKQLSEARLTLASAPLELQHIEREITRFRSALDALQADYHAQRKALVMLDRAKQSELDRIDKERLYGLMREQRVTEMKVDELSRERTALEEALERDFTTGLDMFTSLAASHLEAELAVANTIDEFQVVSPPTFPESPPRRQHIVYGGGAFMACFSALFVLAAFAVILRTLIRNIQASEAPDTATPD
ncbi:MAG: Wzz/FepE/Etk N-terminal domain-containing protein [Candidatus Hydrogenedentales bacterium]